MHGSKFEPRPKPAGRLLPINDRVVTRRKKKVGDGMIRTENTFYDDILKACLE
jgi:hypothetical protein